MESLSTDVDTERDQPQCDSHSSAHCVFTEWELILQPTKLIKQAKKHKF